ncbi:sortase B [Bacilli bacterium PM5-3]|nr:sortase B [Bacilli bacterium PM5-3]MDH6603546.1 sortase B [Bacilli bacterium PM5-9]
MKKNKSKNTFEEKESPSIKFVRGLNNIVDYIVLLIFLLFIIYGSYAMWDNKQVIFEASSDKYTAYKPSSESDDNSSFDELKKLNKEVIAWLDVYGTKIDYPITHTSNNSKYLSINAKKEPSLAGSLYLDYRNNRKFKDFNNIIYGHHMDGDAMFGNIDLFNDKEFFDNHKYGNIYFNEKGHGLEFFAFFEVDAYNYKLYNPNVKGKNEITQYLSYLNSIAKYSRNINIKATDQIVLLSTCENSSTNGRQILAAKVSDKEFENPFIENIENENKERVNQQSLIIKILLFLLLIILIILLLWLLLKRRKKEKEVVEE